MPKTYSVTIGPAVPNSLSTSFGTNEATLSEGGVWTHNNAWFNTVRASGGLAVGNNPNPNPGNVLWDANAFLAGTWNPNQYASAHIHKGSTGGYLEVELFLRGSDTANSTSGYECYLHQNGDYVTVMKYAGTPLSTYATYPAYFDQLANANNVQVPQHGDLFEAYIVGNIITVKLAGTTLLTVDVSSGGRTPVATGKPGIGFTAGGSGAETANDTFCFSDFYATEL